MILLDTNVLIDLDSVWLDPAQSYVASALSRAELELGVRRAPTLAEREIRQARLAALDALFDWLPFDRAASTGYGIVAGSTALTGVRLRSKDALIAGQAMSQGLTIMTRNTADYLPFAQHVTVVAPLPLEVG
ncbi:MAG: PIN domain-containing protein [Propionibacteriaceae bacterium]|jgi:predicted nucleic acid-binding protein|nr:PIN domain-containing protein [Propionibacteriaceae bacterium]